MPVGNHDQLWFNAHRIFKISTIVNELKELRVVSASYIYDYEIHELDVDSLISVVLPDNYVCGMFIFEK